MCGIGGWLANEAMTDNQITQAMSKWAQMMKELEVRGTDAAGMFNVEDDGRVRFAKTAGPASYWARSVKVAGRLPIVIGHTRHATQGHPRDNVNNHPFIIDPIVGVHNGMYTDYQLVAYKLSLKGLCDSEAIFAQLAAVATEREYLEVLGRMNAFNRVVFWHLDRRRLYAYSNDRNGLVMAYDNELPVTWIASADMFLPQSAGRSSALTEKTLYTIAEKKAS